MKNLYLILLICTSCICFGQDISETVYTNYAAALSKAEMEKKPLFIYLGKKPELFNREIIKNDTIQTILSKEFINLFVTEGKDRRALIKRYEAKQIPLLFLDYNESMIDSIQNESVEQLTKKLQKISTGTFFYFTDEFRDQFVRTDSTEILDAINSVFTNSSTQNTRKLTLQYLKEQQSLLTPINYQLMKTLMPTEDEELVNRLLQEMKPEMYTPEMAEKIAFDILLINNYSIQKTKQQIAAYNIPFNDRINRYLAIATSDSYRERKENCFEFVLEASTHDYQALSDCFRYILKNGSQKQRKELEQKYLFTMNEVAIGRSLVMADLLADLFLSKGDLKTFQILKKRNENLRKKYSIN